jgi:hypothetical protein
MNQSYPLTVLTVLLINLILFRIWLVMFLKFPAEFSLLSRLLPPKAYILSISRSLSQLRHLNGVFFIAPSWLPPFYYATTMMTSFSFY